MRHKERFTLANKAHLNMLVALLMASGSMCPKCSHGTRATSKNWARCKKCGERVRRRPLDAIVPAHITARLDYTSTPSEARTGP